MKKFKAFFKTLTISEKFDFWLSVLVVTYGLLITVLSWLKILDYSQLISAILLILVDFVISNMIERYSLLRRIEKNTRQLRAESTIRNRQKVEKDYPLEEMWKDARSIHVAAMAWLTLTLPRLLWIKPPNFPFS